MKFGTGIVCAAAIISAGGVWADGLRKPRWNEIPNPARAIAAQLGVTASNFNSTLEAIDRRSAARLLDGDWDDLIYYLLQSRSFTDAPPIEPARSAIEFAASNRIPAAVNARMKAFLEAMKQPSNDRQEYLARLLPSPASIAEHYGRSMKFLQEKEIDCRQREHPQACIASLYQSRGLSTDTSAQAFRSVEAAMQWIGKNRPDFRARQILILGPGLNFAPRTDLQDDTPPVVYQPRQVRQLLRPERLDCADINPLVISYAKSACDFSYQMNIATALPEPSAHWDLIIATNVLLYLDDTELLLAMNNLRQMLNPGGMFLHNDARFQVSLFGKACGLPAIQFGDIVLDGERKPPLTDRYVLHETGTPRL
jgi:hypothetical protein